MSSEVNTPTALVLFSTLRLMCTDSTKISAKYHRLAGGIKAVSLVILWGGSVSLMLTARCVVLYHFDAVKNINLKQSPLVIN